MPKNELQRVRDRIKEVMDRKGTKNKPLAKKAGLGETSIRDMLENTERDIKLGTLLKLSDALDVPIEELVGAARVVQVAGRIGAGGNIIYEELHDEFVMRPPGIDGDLEALEVQGDSMLPRYSDGDVIYIEKKRQGVPEEFFGEYCAVRVTTGETFLKLLARGSRPGFVTLRSLNAADMEDVELEWATPVVFVLPRAARRRMGF